MLRLIVENEAGSISGTVTYTGQDPAPASMVVYAYEDGSFDSETETSSGDDTNEFSGAEVDRADVTVSAGEKTTGIQIDEDE